MNELTINTELITKEQAREQFNRITKQYSLVHTFSFDEVYDMLMEKRIENYKKNDYRKKLAVLESKIKATPGTFGEDPFPLVHTFTDGLYIRQVTVPATALTVTKIHCVNHVFFIVKGTVSILTENGVVTHTAPYQGLTKAGTKRVIYHHDEVIFTTVHATNKINVKDVEGEIFTMDYSKSEEMIGKIKIADFAKAKGAVICQE